MTTIVVAESDSQKTEGQLNLLPRMCQLWHILTRPSADI